MLTLGQVNVGAMPLLEKRIALPPHRGAIVPTSNFQQTSPHYFQQLRPVVRWPVHPRADRPEPEKPGRAGGQHRAEIALLLAQPGGPVPLFEDHRHPVMDRGHILIGRGDDDREGARR